MRPVAIGRQPAGFRADLFDDAAAFLEGGHRKTGMKRLDDNGGERIFPGRQEEEIRCREIVGHAVLLDTSHIDPLRPAAFLEVMAKPDAHVAGYVADPDEEQPPAAAA